MAESVKNFALRLPVDLFSQVQELADDERRSVNNEIVILLEKSVSAMRTLEDADDARFYREGKAQIAGAEMLSVNQAEAELERLLAGQAT